MGRDEFTDPLIWEISGDGSQYTGFKGNKKALVLRSRFDESFISYVEVLKSPLVSESYYLGAFTDLGAAKEACVTFIRTGGKFGKETGVGGE